MPIDDVPTGLALHLFLQQSSGATLDCATVSEQLVPGLAFPSHAHQLWALVVESFQGWETRINDAAATAGLSPVSAWALVQLDPDDPISQKELSARLRCNPSTVVDPTDRLEDAGLVRRKADRDDRRVNVLLVTARGKRVREKLIDRLFDPPAAFRGLSGGEQVRFRDVMLAVVTGAQPSMAPAARKPRKRSRLNGGGEP
jgi:MarR family transcriptional regulator, organic hydroperoxide resistance regulator